MRYMNRGFREDLVHSVSEHVATLIAVKAVDGLGIDLPSLSDDSFDVYANLKLEIHRQVMDIVDQAIDELSTI